VSREGRAVHEKREANLLIKNEHPSLKGRRGKGGKEGDSSFRDRQGEEYRGERGGIRGVNDRRGFKKVADRLQKSKRPPNQAI